MKRLHMKVSFELRDESGSHSVGNNSLMGATEWDGVSDISEADYDKDPKAAVAAVVAERVLCSPLEAKEAGERAAEELVSN